MRSNVAIRRPSKTQECPWATPSSLGAGTIQLALINAVDLKRWHHRFNGRHHALAHIAVQRVVTAESNHPMTQEMVLDLEIRLTHFDKGLGIVRPGDHAAIVVSE